MKFYCGDCGKECQVVEEHSGPYPANSIHRTDLDETVALTSRCCDAEVYSDRNLSDRADEFAWASEEMLQARVHYKEMRQWER